MTIWRNAYLIRRALLLRRKENTLQNQYQPEWATQIYLICPSDKGAMFAYCKVCNVHVNVSLGGKYDVIRHSKSTSHGTLKNATKTQPQMKSFFVTSKTTDQCVKRLRNSLPSTIYHFRWLIISRNWPISCSPIAILKTTMIVKKGLVPRPALLSDLPTTSPVWR